MTTSTLTPRQTFRETVAVVAARAKEKLPQAVNGRIESAARLVLLHDVHPQADGSIEVGSSTDPMKTYRLEGTTCTCQDFTSGKAPDGWCKHRTAAGIWKRVQELLPAEPEPLPEPPPVEPWPDNDPEPEPEAPEVPVVTVPDPVVTPIARRTIPAKYIQKLQGKDFVRFAGLLQAAQADGLVSLTAAWTHNEAELSLAHAVATFADGRRYEESGDSSPQSAKNIGLHWRRMSLTRAKARALRDALGLEECSVEELD
jgi:hypothetical protein